MTFFRIRQHFLIDSRIISQQFLTSPGPSFFSLGCQRDLSKSDWHFLGRPNWNPAIFFHRRPVFPSFNFHCCESSRIFSVYSDIFGILVRTFFNLIYYCLQLDFYDPGQILGILQVFLFSSTRFCLSLDKLMSRNYLGRIFWVFYVKLPTSYSCPYFRYKGPVRTWRRSIDVEAKQTSLRCNELRTASQKLLEGNL